ncbi:MAG: sulfotransferase family 2 domain-containing protein [Kordiimonadaceae bacterium]|nr:sulfotransferase family 2 domain-containing protein [Kordiimonadaceae bacterium]
MKNNQIDWAVRPVLSDSGKRAVTEARELLEAEDSGAALAVVDAALAQNTHIRLERLKSRLLVLEGRDAEAGEILSRILPEVVAPGFWELALTGSARSFVRKAKHYDLLYFPAPKCGSTSIRNMLNILDGEANVGEYIHDQPDRYELIDHNQLDEEFPDHRKLVIVRDPIERVRSYYFGNIEERDQLKIDVGGKDSFYGLSTKPSYDEFLDRFMAYRRVFITVRHHTEPATSYAGSDAGLFDKIGSVRKLAEVTEYLSDLTGVSLPLVHDMQTKRSKTKPEGFSAAEQSLQKFYARDYSVFGEWF